MFYHSTNRKIKNKTFKEVLFDGLAPDGGLYMPDSFPVLNPDFLKNLPEITFADIAFEVSKQFISDVPEKELKSIIADAFSKESFDAQTGFPAPIIHPVRNSPPIGPLGAQTVGVISNGVKIGENIFVEELFHGPTMAFKDFGARFMSRLMGYYLKQEKRKLKIIVATSGDTGSAVAAGFYNVPGIKVFILYPSGKVSELQEKQLTTFGGNITAIEVRGSFDDCQKLAKQVLSDKLLNGNNEFSSANSINFGRLLPQMFYYFHGYAQVAKSGKKDVVFSVPSGNFGNLTAGIMAKKLGLPIAKFIAATNINDIVPEYLKTGVFKPKISQKTMSNSMDVGNPSNFARMLKMYENSANLMPKDIIGISVSEEETAETIKSVYDEAGYIIDPHTAVAVRGAQQSGLKDPIIALATAHPIKFKDSVEPIIGKKIEVPEKLKATLKKSKKSILIENSFEELKKILE